MRLVTTTLLVCSLSTLGALAQDPPATADNPELEAIEAPAAEETPAAAPEATPEPSSLQLSDQEFLQIPGDADRPAEPSLFEEDTVFTGEMPAPSDSDGDYIEPNDLLPDYTAEIPAFDPRTAAMAGDEQERKLKRLYREVRTKAEKDPAVASLLQQAETAKTFEGERAAYREYYRTLFRKMRQLDKSLTKKCDLMEKSYLDRLAQNRIEPTIPLEPPPKPEPLANN